MLCAWNHSISEGHENSQGWYTQNKYNMILRSYFTHILLLVSAISVARTASSLSIENDRMALLALKDGFMPGGVLPADNFLNSWNSSVHVCDWKGIKCWKRHKRVTMIHLMEQKLNGIISPMVGNLSFLKVLYLSNNSLHGEIPRQIGNLGRLQYLDLQVNLLQGRIPFELSNCSNLIYMSLATNELTGRIPFQLGSLTKITMFSVGRNYLVGEMPTFFRNFSLLTDLSVGYNNLHGEIRDSLQGLSKLTDLTLHFNNFSGMISTIYNLSSLEALELSRNNFTGTLPKDIDIVFPKLTWISLHSNGFSGTIPSTLSNISELSVIQMNYNKFRGRVPDNIGLLKSLRILSFAANNLGGSVDSNELMFIDSLVNCSTLESLSFGINRFFGLVPNSVGNLSINLELFDLKDNYITGAIPDGIGQLSGLSWIDFSRNMLSGTIPDSIGKLSDLSILVLSENKLHGAIPSSLGNLTKLYILNISTNSLNGNVPTALLNCMSIQLIDISSNYLEGYLPDDVFSRWEKLSYCNLSHNSFDGRFPSICGNLRTLSALDASHNNFTGEIPAELSESLEFLSMAGNSFEGNIPASLGSLKGLLWLDLSNNSLSGEIAKEIASLVLLQNLNLSLNHLEGEVPIFQNVTKVSVFGNSKLCGRNLELHLQPCFIEKKRFVSQKVVVTAVASTVAVSTLILLLFIFFCRRGKHKKDIADGLAERYRRITYAELLEATAGFAESNLIGTGSFGDVFKGYLDGDDTKLVAVKVLKLSKHGATESFIAECKVLRNIRHRNLLRIITACSGLDHKGNNFKALVFDFMSNGNLDSWLHINRIQEARAPLTLAKRLQIALDVASALNYLHNCCEPPIVHCDLKPSNILLDDDMVAHVGDFGLAKLLSGAIENTSGSASLSTFVRGTVGYVAPEYGMGATISPQGDIYSYGVLILELITGKRPTDEMFNNDTNLHSFIERALPNNTEEVVDEFLVNELYEAMTTQTNPEQYKLEWHTCIVSFIEVGILCSAESSKDRMEIQSAIKCLMGIKEKCGIIC